MKRIGRSLAPKPACQHGFTLIELLVAMTLLMILASVALPLSEVSDRRAKELALKQNLRSLRQAIDRFKQDWDLRRISHLESNTANPENGYPVKLELLVEGVPSNDAEGKVRRYLRRILKDPITGERTWGLRCYADAPDSNNWCGKDVFDVYPMSDHVALDGTRYRDW